MPIQNRNDLLNAFAKIDKVVSASGDALIKAGREYPEVQTQAEKNAGLALIARITKEIEACEKLAREARAWVELPENSNETDLQICQQEENALELVRTYNLPLFNVKVNSVWVGSAGDRAFLRGEEPPESNSKRAASKTTSAQKSSTTHQDERITQAERDYLTHFDALGKEIDAALAQRKRSPELKTKQYRAQTKAIVEAGQLWRELRKQLPLSEGGTRLKAMPQKYAHSPKGIRLEDKKTGKPYLIDDEALLVRLTDICSHTTQGLHFLTTGGELFSCNMFYGTGDRSGTTKQMIYDIDAHKAGMVHLESMAHSLKGAGWKDCRKALLIIAGVMLVAAGILAAVPTGGISLAATLGGVAILTAGAGFFAGRDTGLAGAVKGIKMKSVENQEEIAPSKTSPNKPE